MNEWVVALVATGALTVSALAGWPLTAFVLRLAARSGDASQHDDASPHDASPHENASPGGEAAPPEGVPRHGREVPARAPDPSLPTHTPDAGPTGRSAREVLRGGTWIGILERLAVTGCLLAGYPSGIAFVVAVKGLGRYPELRNHPTDPGISERFVIGTLASMLWAAAVGGAVRWLLLG